MVYRFFIFSFFIVFGFSCKKEILPSTFDYPPILLPEATTTIDAIWERVEQNQQAPILFEREEDSLWVHVYVTSSDEAGNFYNALYAQDDPETPHRAVRLLLDQNALSDLFPIGRKLAIYLNGLGAGFQNGMMSLGRFDGAEIQPLTPFEFKQHLVGSSEVVKVKSIPLSLNDLHLKDAGKWIRLDGVQLAKSALGKTFSGEGTDAYDGMRRLVQCDNYHSLLLSTSVYADFKSLQLPEASGSIQGILTKDYYGRHWVLQPNFSTDLSMSGARCDPFFEQNFEQAYLGAFDQEHWYNISAEGSQLWEVYEDTESLGRSLRIGSYRSGDTTTETWLISPLIDVSILQNPMFDFRSSVQYPDKSVLAVYYSTTWNGTITGLVSATWVELPFQLASANHHSSEWVDAGALALPQTEKLHLAFRYSGSGKTTFDGTFEIDDIRVFDNK